MNKKLRVGVVGVGHLGKFHAEKYHINEDCFLHSVSDTSPERGHSVADAYNCIYHSDYKSMVGMVDAVSVAAPTTLHFEITDFFLSHGVHVLVEKPMVKKLSQLEQLKEISKNRLLMSGHTYLYNPAITKIKEIVDSGILGDIMFIHSQRLNFGIMRDNIDVFESLAPHDISLVQFFLNDQAYLKISHEKSMTLSKS